MTGIDRHISELLFDHDCVILPGFGGFLTNYSGARIHPIKHSFQPPSRTVVFNAKLRTNDGLLTDHVSRMRKLSYQEASNLVKEYAEACMRDLEAGKTIHFAHIGNCRMGKEKNIVFDPDLSSNYLADAFGLPSFVSPAIQRETVRQRLEKQLTPRPTAPDPEKRRNLRPVFGWAAGIAIPLAAAALMYFYAPSFVDGLNNNYASFVPTIKFHSTEKAIEPVTTKKNAEFADFRVIPEETVKAEAIPEVVPDPLPEAVPETPAPHILRKYQIVVGAFSEEANAEKYVQELKQKDYDASIVGTSRNGLIRVSINGLDDKAKATDLLAQIRRDENPSAWLLRIK